MLDLSSPLVPRDAADILQIVRDACDTRRPLELLGQGTKRGVGHPVSAGRQLDLSGLSGITFYEPEEIVLSAHAGTPLAEIEAALARENQELAFEPMDYGPLFDRPRGGGTLGGTLAANISGPRRIKAGAARDHVLGIEAVSGRGDVFKSGGRVVKNVTGYDLSKGLAGSWGTLAVLTGITFKVLPRPEASSTLVLFDLDDRAAVEILCAAMGSAGEISGAAHLPLACAETIPQLAGAGTAATLLRLEGFRPSVLYRAERVSAMIGGEGRTIERIDDADSASLWSAVRDVEPFAGSERPVWRISVAPTSGPVFVELLAGKLAFRHFFDWSGGLIWLEVSDAPPDGGAAAIRESVRTLGGHATLIRGSRVENVIPRFEPQPQSLTALSTRLKASFDPLNILNPGRMG